MVVKAQKVADLIDGSYSDQDRIVVRPSVDPEKTIYACKIFDIERCSKDDLLRIFKEIKINTMLDSQFCLKYYQTIKTQIKIYMIQEYANCFRVDSLLKVRGSIR